MTEYAELHSHSNFSFLDGASHPEELVEEAARLGLEALALTDHDGLYGVVRFAEAARRVGLPTVFGAELTLGLPRPAERRRRPRGPAPGGPGPRPGPGYARLCRAISEAPAAPGGPRASPVFGLEELALGPPRPLAGAHRVPQGDGAGRPHAERAGRRRAPARPAGRRLRAPARGRRAVGPRRPPRLGPQRRPGRAGRPRRGPSWWPPPTSTTPPRPASAWPPPWPRSGPGGQPRRDGRVAPGRARRPPALGGGAGPAVRPLPRGGRARGRARARPAPSTSGWWRRGCRPSRSPTATTR